MKRHFFIGVDGGGSKCRLRLEDEDGNILGRVVTGAAANIRLSVETAWQVINNALDQLLQAHSLNLKDHFIHAGMGLAGCEVKEAYEAFIKVPHAFKTLGVTSDSHTACLGAHAGKDGAILIAGTGVVGLKLVQGELRQVGGFGFPHDDEGGGAWLGLEATKLTLKSLDGRQKPSTLTKAILSYFSHDQSQLISWANRANSTEFAELAPIVIELATQQDPQAKSLLQEAAKKIEALAEVLFADSRNLPFALVGGVAPFLEPYFDAAFKDHLQPCLDSPDGGAVLFIRNLLEENK